MQTNDQSIPDKKIIPSQKLVELDGPRPRLKEFKFAIQIFFEFIKGFRTLNFVGPCITVFGSARFKEGHPYYEQARKMGQKIAELGFVTMTGGGPGIMKRPIEVLMKLADSLLVVILNCLLNNPLIHTYISLSHLASSLSEKFYWSSIPMLL